jgi:2-hydroxy-3-keto-5-methylthiopentenyl-1-phosphate phosphatase
MKIQDRKYRGMVSSDWSECLAPSEPFDFITFNYPDILPEVRKIFQAYTGNRIHLSQATRHISALLPNRITEDQMDAYLDEQFVTYRGVPELIEWCSKNGIFFMINSTGMQGYFQRVFKKKLLPEVSAISAHPMIRYKERGRTVREWYDLLETRDKPKNTQRVMHALGLRPDKVVLIGDSAGDGPHFEWGARMGTFLVGSMSKWSLTQYCLERGIEIDLYFGLRYLEGEKRQEKEEAQVNFVDLIPKIEVTL